MAKHWRIVDHKNVERKEDELIVELAKNLADTSKVFCKLNGLTNVDKESFHILYNGNFAYFGVTLKKMLDTLTPESQDHFKNEAIKMLTAYLEMPQDDE